MHKLLQKYLNKLGINDSTELKGDEKEVFDNWKRVLSNKDDVTVESIIQFCKYQLSVINKQLDNLDNGIKKNERLILMQVVYRAIVNTIEAPRIEREALEKHLNSLI